MIRRIIHITANISAVVLIALAASMMGIVVLERLDLVPPGLAGAKQAATPPTDAAGTVAAPQAAPQVVEVTRLVTVVVTATPAGTPTPAPPAQGAAILPEGWLAYQFSGSGVTLAYPPAWILTGEEAGEITFRQGDRTVVAAELADGSSLGADLATQVRSLKLFALTRLDQEAGAVEFTAAGQIDAPHRPAYITALLAAPSLKNTHHSLLLTYATNGKRVVVIYLLDALAAEVSDQDMDTLTRLVRSVQFPPPEETRIHPVGPGALL